MYHITDPRCYSARIGNLKKSLKLNNYKIMKNDQKSKLVSKSSINTLNIQLYFYFDIIFKNIQIQNEINRTGI